MKLAARDLALLRDFLAVAQDIDAKCFLVGAGARVLGFERRWELRAARATLDWDFAIRAQSWQHWSRLKARLVEGAAAKFRIGREEHRFQHVAGAMLDLVPYGEIESGSGEITWPNEVHMFVHGFGESEMGCEFIEADAGLLVPVAAIPSLALLKLHAYRDRRQRGERKDIQDFDWYLANYEAAGNELRIHEELGEALRGEMIELSSAGAALLGSDVGTMHSEDAIAPSRSLLAEARDPWSRLIADVRAGGSVLGDDEDRLRRAEIRARFAAFEWGLDRNAKPLR